MGCAGWSGGWLLPPSLPLEHGIGPGIGLLALDAPVLELLERDRHAGDRAAHIGARPHHAEIAIELLDLRLAGHGRARIEAVEHGGLHGSRAPPGDSPAARR